MSFIQPSVGDFKFSAFLISQQNGWILCDGRNLSRTTYSALFNVIGTDFGVGDGSTTFGIPNAAGKVFAVPTGGFSLGQSIGNTTSNASITQANLPAYNLTVTQTPHIHSITDVQHSHQIINDPRQSVGQVQSGTGEETYISNSGTGYTESNYSGITATNGNEANITVNTGGSNTPLSINVMQPTLFAGFYYIYAGI